MKTVLPGVFVLALVSLSACAPKVNDPADIQAVKQTVEAYGKAVNAGDTEGALAMMSDKTIYADNHFPVAVGKAAVQSMITAQNSMFKTGFQVPVDEVRVAGDIAVARGTWAITLTPKAEEIAPISDSGSWMLLASRQADGSWKWDWVVPSSNQPMPGATADGADEQAVLQLERDSATALVKRDMAFLERGIAKEYTSVTDGKVDDVKKMIAEFKAGASRIESATLRDLKAYVFGDVAIATMTGASNGTYMGKPFSNTYRGADFLIKRDGRWQVVSTQNTTIKQ